METLWFVIVALMLVAYVVLDGFDIGAGIIHLIAGRNDEERRTILRAIGPVWDGNEVWLLAAGGTLYFAFPLLYASSFSGFYLPLMMVLWLLMLRAIGIEFRTHLESPVWRAFFDVVFSVSSILLAIFFGAALGNVVRGVPLNAEGFFQLTLFHILNWYALLIGVAGLLVLCMQGASFLAVRATGALAERARRWARVLVWVNAAAFLALIGPTIAVREAMWTNLTDHPWTFVFPTLAFGGVAVMVVAQRRGLWLRAFLGSSAFIAGLLATMAAGLYPYILPAHEGKPFGLTIDRAAAGHDALRTALFWWPIGMALAALYFVYAYWLFFRRASVRSTSATTAHPG